jgi:hypothetical protein
MSESTQIIFLKAEPRAARRETLSLQRCSLCGSSYPNDVVILQDVADVAKARTWFGSDDLKAAMQKSGVLGSPNVRFAAAA